MAIFPPHFVERLIFNKTEFDVELRDYKYEGLSEPSVVRVDKVIEIDKDQLLYRYGKISERDWTKVYKKLVAYKNNNNQFKKEN